MEGGAAGRRCNWNSDENTSKCMSKHHFFDVMSEVQKYLEDFSAEKAILFKSDTLEFCLEFDVAVDKVNFDLALHNLG
jgi:hypothetical protein